MVSKSKENINWTKLAQYLAGEGSPSEQSRLEAWVQADAERRVLAGRLRRVWEAAEVPPDTPPSGELDVEADWEELVRKMRTSGRRAPASKRRPASQHSPTSHRGPMRRRRTAWPHGQFARIAVLLVLIAGGAFLVAELSGMFSGTGSSLREIVTGRGERATVRLADGTEVTLNVDSRLRLPATFGQRPVREVYLRGEAYFDVAPNPEHPFIIHAGNGLIRVEGTAFNVEAYPEEQAVEVAVTEGTVLFRVERREQGIRLEAGQLGRLIGEDVHAIELPAHVDVEAYLSWIEGRLVFRNTPLREVATRLERWYDVECTIEGDEIGSLHFTGVLNSRSIRDVLEVVTASLGLAYRIEGNTVVLWREEA